MILNQRYLRTGLLGVLGVFLLCANGLVVAAENYPVRAIRLVVPFAPGGFIDFTGRLLAGPLGTALGQQVIVDNRAGAGGVVGSEIVARAPADGYTVVIGSAGTHGVNQSLYPKLPFHVLRDFVPVARLVDAPSILAVHPSLPVRQVKDLLNLARTKPNQLTYGSAGAGTSTHLAAVLFEHLGHVKFVHIPYKGGGPSLVALITGEVTVSFGTAAATVPHLSSGKLRALAVTSGQRATGLPDLPTIAEGGLAGYEMLNWLGMFVPAGTPPAIVQKLGTEAIRVIRQPDMLRRLQAQGAEPSTLAAPEFAAFVKKEVAKWAEVVTATGMTAN